MTARFSLSAEIDWYLKHQADLERSYWGKWILIRNQQVHVADPDEAVVLAEGKRLFGHEFYAASVGLPKPPLQWTEV